MKLNEQLLADKLINKIFISYEDLNELLPAEYISEDVIEEVFSFLEKNNIKLLNNKELNYKVNYSSKQELILNNLIDTPDKFYFYELNHNIDSKQKNEESYLVKINEIKKEISHIIINTNFFFYQFYRSLRKINNRINNVFYLNHDIYLIKDIYKDLFKHYQQINTNEKIEYKKTLFNYLSQIDCKFTYILSLFFELQKIYKMMNKLKSNSLDKDLKLLERKKKITLSETKDLLAIINTKLNKYDKIKQELTISYLPLVISIAKHFANDKISINDLIQEGNLALLESIDLYNYEQLKKEFIKFSTNYIKKKMKNLVSTYNHSFNVSIHFKNEVKLYLTTVTKLKNELLRLPQLEEIKNELKWNDDKIILVSNYLRSIKSLEKEDEYEQTNLKDALKSHKELNPDTIAIENVFKDKIKDLLSQIKPKEQSIIKMRFGFNAENKIFSYQEISDILNIPVKTIIALEEHALKKLKIIFKKNDMDSFVNDY